MKREGKNVRRRGATIRYQAAIYSLGSWLMVFDQTDLGPHDQLKVQRPG